MKPGQAVDARKVRLGHEPVDADQIVAGDPQTGWVELGKTQNGAYGVWEMTPGTMSDVETDEVFVVVSGRGVVEILDGDGATVVLRPGSVMRLTAGMHTMWTVHETLRKVYVTPA